MKTTILATLFSLTLVLSAFPDDLVGKTVTIKTSKSGASGIVLVNSAPKIGSLVRAKPKASTLKVSAGIAPGTVAFESVGQPGFFLHHTSKHLVLLPKADADGSFRVVSAVQGNQGVSLQSYNFPDHHITAVTKDDLRIVKDIQRKLDAVFYIEEQK